MRLKLTIFLTLFISLKLFANETNKSRWGVWETPHFFKIGINSLQAINFQIPKNGIYYSHLIGINFIVNEIIEFSFNPINLVNIPPPIEYYQNYYFNFSFYLNIIKYEYIINENLFLQILFGASIGITLKSGIFVNKNINALLYSASPNFSIKFNLEFIEKKLDLFLRYTTTFSAFGILESGINFLIF